MPGLRLRAVRALVFSFFVLHLLPGAGDGANGPTILASYKSRMGANRLTRVADHAGVDFAAPRGSPVLAAADGEVVHVGVDAGGCGIGVLLAHPDYKRYTVYCHMEAVDVSEGQRVRRGERIGRIGTTGDAVETPHVHLELCSYRCQRGHKDGYLGGTEDPLHYIAGCFKAGKQYPHDRLVLTPPVGCVD